MPTKGTTYMGEKLAQKRNAIILKWVKKSSGYEATKPMLQSLTGLTWPRLLRGCAELERVGVLVWVASERYKKYAYRWTGRGIPLIRVNSQVVVEDMKKPRKLVETEERVDLLYPHRRFVSGVERELGTWDRQRSRRSLENSN